MKHLPALALALSLAGCAQITAAITTADNALAKLSENSLPKACAIVKVAEGYFRKLEPRISADKIAIERKAEAAVAVICDNPPKDTGAAFTTLVDLWFTIQDATKTN